MSAIRTWLPVYFLLAAVVLYIPALCMPAKAHAAVMSIEKNTSYCVGDTQIITVSKMKKGVTYSFESSNPSVLKVTKKTGRLTALKAGTAKITLYKKKSKKRKKVQTVKVEVVNSVFDPTYSEYTLGKYNSRNVLEYIKNCGSNVEITAESNNQAVVWVSDQEGSRTINTGSEYGTADITFYQIYQKDKVKLGTMKLTVSEPVLKTENLPESVINHDILSLSDYVENVSHLHVVVDDGDKDPSNDPFSIVYKRDDLFYQNSNLPVFEYTNGAGDGTDGEEFSHLRAKNAGRATVMVYNSEQPMREGEADHGTLIGSFQIDVVESKTKTIHIYHTDFRSSHGSDGNQYDDGNKTIHSYVGSTAILYAQMESMMGKSGISDQLEVKCSDPDMVYAVVNNNMNAVYGEAVIYLSFLKAGKSTITLKAGDVSVDYTITVKEEDRKENIQIYACLPMQCRSITDSFQFNLNYNDLSEAAGTLLTQESASKLRALNYEYLQEFVSFSNECYGSICLEFDLSSSAGEEIILHAYKKDLVYIFGHNGNK